MTDSGARLGGCVPVTAGKPGVSFLGGGGNHFPRRHQEPGKQSPEPGRDSEWSRPAPT